MAATEPAQVTRSCLCVRRGVLYTAFFLCFACFALVRWVVWPIKVWGDSMTPTYHHGQPTYINKVAYWSRDPQRGDVVALSGAGEFQLKRIVGLPGEQIEFSRGVVLVNGSPLQEPYVGKRLLWLLPPVELGSDEYFVMGDNRSISVLGPVRKERIIGRAIF